MCTAVTWQNGEHYFGRTLDHDSTWGEEVTVMPRNFMLPNLKGPHYAMIGMAHVVQDHPLYYDGMNEKGLAMAGLNFVGNAVYQKPVQNKENLPHYDFISRILGTCATVKQARAVIEGLNLTGEAFSEDLPPAQLHWLIADKQESITVEPMGDGLRIWENPVGVLTNNPSFPQQLFELNNYRHLSPKPPRNRFSEDLELELYSRGMGALGLPGDLSSRSRFVRAAFVKCNSRSGQSEKENVSQFFHILGSVDQPRGCCEL